MCVLVSSSLRACVHATTWVVISINPDNEGVLHHLICSSHGCVLSPRSLTKAQSSRHTPCLPASHAGVTHVKSSFNRACLRLEISLCWRVRLCRFNDLTHDSRTDPAPAAPPSGHAPTNTTSFRPVHDHNDELPHPTSQTRSLPLPLHSTNN